MIPFCVITFLWGCISLPTTIPFHLHLFALCGILPKHIYNLLYCNDTCIPSFVMAAFLCSSAPRLLGCGVPQAFSTLLPFVHFGFLRSTVVVHATHRRFETLRGGSCLRWRAVALVHFPLWCSLARFADAHFPDTLDANAAIWLCCCVHLQFSFIYTNNVRCARPPHCTATVFLFSGTRATSHNLLLSVRRSYTTGILLFYCPFSPYLFSLHIPLCCINYLSPKLYSLSYSIYCGTLHGPIPPFLMYMPSFVGR